MDASYTLWLHIKKDKTNMNKNYHLEELIRKVESLEKRIKLLEELLFGDSK